MLTGDDRPPDELNHITNMTLPGQHFGFPYCYGKDLVDPQFNTYDTDVVNCGTSLL